MAHENGKTGQAEKGEAGRMSNDQGNREASK
jgi:hypothetical protein